MTVFRVYKQKEEGLAGKQNIITFFQHYLLEELFPLYGVFASLPITLSL